MAYTTRKRDVTVIELGPDYRSLDDEALAEFGELLIRTATTVDPPRVVLDMSATDYVGSTFLELLVRAWKRLRERGGTMVLCGVQPFCSEVLRVSRLDTLWDSFPAQDQAVAAVNG